MNVLLHQPCPAQGESAAWLEVGGQSLIAWHLEKLADSGLRQVTIRVPDARNRNIESLRRFNLDLQIMDANDGSLASVWSNLDPAAPLLAIRADIWTSYDFARLARGTRNEAHLVLTDNDADRPAGDLGLLPDGIVRVGGALKRTYTGIACLSPSLLARMSTVDNGLVTGSLSPLLHEIGPALLEAISLRRVSGEYHAGPWTHIRHPDHLNDIDGVIVTE